MLCTVAAGKYFLTRLQEQGGQWPLNLLLTRLFDAGRFYQEAAHGTQNPGKKTFPGRESIFLQTLLLWLSG